MAHIPPCATLKRTGKGATLYIAGYCNDDTITAILDLALPLANIQPQLTVPNDCDIEIIDLTSHLLLINHGNTAVELSIPNLNLHFGGQVKNDQLSLKPNEVAITSRVDNKTA